MGYDIRWAVCADGLTADQVQGLREHVRRWRPRIAGFDLAVSTAPRAGVIAHHAMRPAPRDPEQPASGGNLPEVVDEILAALAELAPLVAGARVIVEDDFGRRAWDGRDFVATEDAVAWRELGDGWRSLAVAAAEPAAVVDPPSPKEAKLLRGLLAPELGATASRVLDQVGRLLSSAATLALCARLARDRVTRPRWWDDLMTELVVRPRAQAWPCLLLAADDGLERAWPSLTLCAAPAVVHLLAAAGDPRARLLAIAAAGEQDAPLAVSAGDRDDGVAAVLVAVASARQALRRAYGAIGASERRKAKAAPVIAALATVAAAVERAGLRAALADEGPEAEDVLVAVGSGTPLELDLVAVGLEHVESHVLRAAGVERGGFLGPAERAAVLALEADLVAQATRVLGAGG